MALIAMAVFDTVENERSWMTRDTLKSLNRTVNWKKHRLIISDNGSCDKTFRIYDVMREVLTFELIENGQNLGTAAAINLAWRDRRPGEAAVKMDNDCVIFQKGWVDWMEDVFARDPKIGICGLKRKDLAERPDHPNQWYKSEVRMLPHEPGQRWLVVEKCRHIMGTCQAYSSALLDQIGYLDQMQSEGNVYGYDDSLASLRSELAGFENVFLHGFEIDHIDPGNSEYTTQKQVNAGQWMGRYHQVRDEYQRGIRDLYYDGGFDK